MGHSAIATNHVDDGNRYARDIVAGNIAACKWIQLACQRHLDDLRKSKAGNFPFFFDHDKAEKACRFIELMPLTKGRWLREKANFTLQPWQKFFVMNVFGWVNSEGHRRFRTACLYVPRKNGKSELAAAIGLLCFAADNEPGAEVYSGASNRNQALKVFGPARTMAKKCEAFREYYQVDINAASLVIEDEGNIFEPLIGKPGDGANPHCAIIDEYHEHDSDDLFSTMETGQAAREQPLILVITTAGFNVSGPCYALQLDCQRMLDGVIADDSLFSLIYTIDPPSAGNPGDDWTDIDSIIKANPNYGVTVREEFVKTELHKALNSPRKQNPFKTKHLNIWVGAKTAYFNLQRWIQAGDPSLKLEDFAGRRCFVGLDLSTRVDIGSLCVLFPLGDQDYVCFFKHYLPETVIHDGENEKYNTWHQLGQLQLTDGDMIDYFKIRDDVLALREQFQIMELCYDPHQATMLVTDLTGKGVPCVEITQNYGNYSQPMKELDGLIRAGCIRHNGEEVARWMIGNVVGLTNDKDEVRPIKERPENKIDGPVALLMALRRAITVVDSNLDSFINDIVRLRRTE